MHGIDVTEKKLTCSAGLFIIILIFCDFSLFYEFRPTGELRQDGSPAQVLIRTEILAADDADEPAYLGEFIMLLCTAVCLSVVLFCRLCVFIFICFGYAIVSVDPSFCRSECVNVLLY